MTPTTLKSWRRAQGLTQSEAARFFGVSNYRTVLKWESGERPIPGYVVTILQLLGDRRAQDFTPASP